jgi:carboxypeptidase T
MRTVRRPGLQILRTAVLLILCLQLIPSPAPPDHRAVEIVAVDPAAGMRTRLEGLGLDPLMEHEGRIFAVAGPAAIAALIEENIPFSLETHRFPEARGGRIAAAGGLNGAFHSYAETEARLQALAAAHPNLARLHVIGESLEKRRISALRIGTGIQDNRAKPAVLFLGCHHAREWISVEVPLLFAAHLLENYNGDPDIRRLLDRVDAWIVPLVNPDGLEYSIRIYRYWRKNRRANGDGSFGVDLNRNFGFQWGLDNLGSSPSPASDVYRGTSAFSEPETSAVRDLFLRHDFRAVVSYHSYSRIILYPWGFADLPTERDLEMERMAADMSALMAPVNGRVYAYGRASASLYLTNGDTTDWTFGTRGVPSFTFELPPVDILGGGFFNAEADIIPIVNENIPAMLYLLSYAATDEAYPPRRGDEDRDENRKKKSLTKRDPRS